MEISDKTKKAMNANIWKFYLQRFFSGIIFTVPIYMLFLQDNGLSVTEILILNAIYTILIIVFDIPAGVLADKWGRKNTYIISCVFYVLGIATYSVGNNFLTFLIAEIIFSLSVSTFGGTGEAILYDSLKVVDKTKNYKKVQGNAYAISSMMYGTMGIFGGIIAVAFTYRHVYYASLPGPIIGFFISLTFTEPKHSVRVEKVGYFKHMKNTMHYVAHHSIIRFIILESAIIALSGFFTYFLFQLHYPTIGVPIAYLGIIFALLFGSAAIGNRTCHYIEEILKEKKSIILVTVLILFGFVLIASVKNWYIAILAGMMIWFVMGYNETFVKDMINKHTESYHRATVLSIESNAHNLLFTITAPLIGVAVDLYSLTTAFLMIAGILAIYFIFIIFYYWMGYEKDDILIQKLQ